MTTSNNMLAPARPVYPSYGAIVTQLLVANQRIREAMRHTGADTPYRQSVWYRDFCTVSVGGGRQTGKTRAISELLEPRTVVVVKDDMMKEVTYKYVVERLSRNIVVLGKLPSPPEGVMLFPMATAHSILEALKKRPRQTIQLTLDDDDPDVHSTIDRLMKELREKNAASDLIKKKAGFDRFIVDDASYFFEKVPIKDFYKWASYHAYGDSPEFIFLG